MRRLCRNSLRLLAHRSSLAANVTELSDPPLCVEAIDATTSKPHLDDLELRHAIVGEGVVLDETEDGGFILYAVDAGCVDAVGRFDQAADAWRAVDALDDARKASASRWRHRPPERFAERLLTR